MRASWSFPSLRAAGRHPLPVVLAVLAVVALVATLTLPAQGSVLFAVAVICWAAAALLALVLVAARFSGGISRVTSVVRQGRLIEARAVTLPVPADLTPAELLEVLRQEASAGENRFLALLKEGRVTNDMLLDLAAQQSYAVAADRRSLLHMAGRFAGTPAEGYFLTLAQAERLAADMLKIFADALGSGPGSPQFAPKPACQAYSAYLAWLALNGSPGDTVLALAAASTARCGTFSALSDALHDRLDERARAYLEFRRTPVPQAEAQALAVAETFRPAGSFDHARLLRAYDLMFWNGLAPEGANSWD